ncbi:DEAD/DEAH box helicase [Nocardioides litoris]|uniref:DEAD/DEAH box helicase n=1 Tax=Nocardioides litoris TaxID=1926648 RepID=UPI001121DE5C|nr:DEAD/DEAH box helicase [Nocardioides litoris]
MSFVPITGTAVFRPADPPRESVVELSDTRRTVELPMRAALPVLARARGRDDLQPSVRLLCGATLLGLRLVADGKLRPDDGSWRIAPLDATDTDRVAQLAASHDTEVEVVRRVLDAVADTVPRAAPSPSPRGTHRPADRPSGRPSGRQTEPRPVTTDPDFAARLQSRIARHRAGPSSELPQLVRLSLRVEADEEELAAGSLRVVLQVHDEQDPLHLCDAAVLFTAEPAEHGFGERARTHAVIALRAAAEAWPALDRLLELRVPDEITLDHDGLVTLLDGGVEALGARGVDVMWPRSLGRDLTSSAVLDVAAPRRTTSGRVREEPLNQPVLSTEALFSFRWQLALHGDPLSEEEMDQLATAASPVMRLRGAWTVVDPATARRARKRLIRTVAPAQAVASTLTGVLEVEPGTDTAVVVGASLMKVRERLLAAATTDPVDPPAALRAQLRDYQRHGLTWLAELTDLGLGACLADDMGLGKTVTLIALHLHRRAAGRTGPTLVVCPASLLGNWEAEVQRFAPGTPVRRFHGGARDLGGFLGGDDGFVLTTYGTLRTSRDDLAAVPWDLVVADEAQHVKNPASATARALRAVPGPTTARVALTGTPVENDLTELWAILDWVVPGLLGSRGAFRKAWAAPIESGQEPRKAAQFAELVSPFLLRRRKSDPGIAPELPPKTETDHPLTLGREQVVLYEAFVRDTMERIERADEDARRGLVLSLLTGLKQICNHPAQFLKQSGAVRLAGRSEKLDLLDELVSTALAEDGAVLVFTQYVALARLLETHLSRGGVTHQLLHGGTPVAERERMVARFQAGEVPVFLLSLKAGGTGLNLTRADHVVHVDRWWNPAVEDQATDRAYRIGQTRPVQVHRMLMRGTVEERVAELLARKRALADAVLGRGEAALTELGDDELRDLVTYRPRA